MDFRLLGPVTAYAGGTEVPLGPPKRRAVAAMLVLAEGAPVTAERLIEALWDTEPPTRARNVLHGHVSRLRGTLRSGSTADVVTCAGGYALRLPPESVDVWRFRSLLHEARAADGAEPRVRLLREALDLWRGPAMGTVNATPVLSAAATRLEEDRLCALRELAAALHELGGHGEAAALLREAIARHPLRESLVAAAVRALHAAGRRSEAVELYLRTQRVLAEELGVDPGPELSDAYLGILRSSAPAPPGGTPGIAAPAAAEPAVRTPGAPAPRLLPRPPAGFVGRAAELALLTEAARIGPSPLCVITGPAGVGKTSLAVHWAHLAAEEYPDGVLHADLHPHESSDTGPQTVEILHGFLSALGVPEDRLPAQGRAAEAMYRSLLADRQVLVLLDNALDSAQVRPLLPGAPGCSVVVTSRNRLAGLVATDCARLLPLDRLTPDGGAAVLRTVLGGARVDAEPRAAQDLSALCDGLPLALRLAAARLVARPRLSLRAMADDLLDEHRRLPLLSTEDLGVEAALRLSRQQLPAAGELLFRQLALHVGTEVDRGAAAALTGLPPAEADRALEELAAAHLLEERDHGRYLMHDLIRLYARSGAAQAAPDGLRRLLAHYTTAALAATAAAEPGSQPCCGLPEGVDPVGPVPRLADRSEAMAWYVTERANLTAAVARAAETGHHAYAWRIAVTLWPLIVRQVHEGWETTLEQALGSALALDDPDAESRLRTLLGWVLTENGRHPQALEHLHRAPALAARAGDRPGEVIAMINWAAALERTGDLDGAGERREQAAVMARALGHSHTETLALYHLADHCLTMGRPERALALCRRALGLAPGEQSEDRRALLLRTCAQALEALGRAAEARRCFAQAAELVADAEPAAYDPINC
ncbi:hypothetical protein ACZ90_03720 [Streptomyces albus subsp. albus]|nr:hypothetical protein ACZ90_03720 [Streptomyces albus subsp. albus]